MPLSSGDRISERAVARGFSPGTEQPAGHDLPAPGGSLGPAGMLLARTLLAQAFLVSGVGKILDWPGNAAALARMELPLVPALLVGSIACEVGGGLSLWLGYKARLGALALAVYLIATTFAFHNFWTYPEPQWHAQQVQFLKNLAILGGLLALASCGPGPWSLDRQWGHRPDGA